MKYTRVVKMLRMHSHFSLTGDEDTVRVMSLLILDNVVEKDSHGDEETDQIRWTYWAKCGNETTTAITSVTVPSARPVANDAERTRKSRKSAECRIVSSKAA